jgi:hypothetical protein
MLCFNTIPQWLYKGRAREGWPCIVWDSCWQCGPESIADHHTLTACQCLAPGPSVHSQHADDCHERHRSLAGHLSIQNHHKVWTTKDENLLGGNNTCSCSACAMSGTIDV